MSEAFAFAGSDPIFARRGSTYLYYNLIGVSAFVYLVIQVQHQITNESGTRRVETQFLTMVALLTGLTIFTLNTAGNILHIRSLNRASLVVILGGYALIGWAIAFHRVFDAKHVFLTLAQRVAILLILSTGIYGAWVVLCRFIPSSFAVFSSAFLFGILCFWLDRRARDFFRCNGEELLASTRNRVIQISRTQHDAKRLAFDFQQILIDRFQVTSAVLLLEEKNAFEGSGINFFKNQGGFVSLCEMGWVTLESLERQRSTRDREDLDRFITTSRLELAVAVPRGSPTPSLIVALGSKKNRWPFTYPEIQRLQDVTELMDNILIHSRLVSQAAMRARMEHLAIISRGLAHDLKNLITPVSSFLIHAEQKATFTGVEAEVHSAAKRSVRIMTEYVREALSFSDRLEPKLELTSIRDILSTVLELTTDRASDRKVCIVVNCESEQLLIADVILVQRMLTNLVSNAVDASSFGGIVTVVMAQTIEGMIRLQVRDQGSGIAPEHLGRIFEPYFTTKEFGDDVRGFGLGLTISQKIVHLHHGTISVESELGRGTTVTVDLPLTQPNQPAVAPCSAPSPETVASHSLGHLA